MSGTENTPRRSLSQLKVEHATANAVSDVGKNAALTSGAGTGGWVRFSAEEKGTGGLVHHPDTVSATVMPNKDGSKTVTVSVGTDDNFIRNGYDHSAMATVQIDPSGHAKAGKAIVTDNDGGPADKGVVAKANNVAQKIESAVNNGAVQPVKAKFSNYSP